MEQQFGVELPSLIEAVSNNLYSDKHVAIRELIQNARDSLVRVSGWHLEASPAITLVANPDRGEVTIRDNGIGLTAAEAERYLAVIAASGTRVMRDRLAESDGGAASALAGQFGLGFLSSLMIADRVEVRSKSRADLSAPGVYWACERGQSVYSMEPLNWDGYGTQVTLRLNPRHRRLASPPALAEVVRKYCSLVEYPIALDDGRPINRLVAPWRLDGATDAEVVEFLREVGGLRPGDDPSFLATFRTDEGCGVLFLPANPTERGGIDLYVKHLFVARTTDCVPEALGFVRGVIDWPDLPLTLSREGAVRGPELDALRAGVQRVLLAELGRAARDRPATYKRVLAAYASLFKQAALKDPEVMRGVGGHLPVRLTTGQTATVSEVAAHGGKVTFIDDDRTQQAYGRAVAARGVPVVDCSDRLDRLFVAECGRALHADVARADTALGREIERSTDPDGELLEGLLAAADETIEPRAATLDDDLPALLVRGRGDELRDLLADARRNRTGGAAAPLLDVLERVMADAPKERHTLLVNVAHPLCRGLVAAARAGADAGVVRAAAGGLIASARLYSAPPDPAERKGTFVAAAAALADLLCYATQTIPEPPAHGATP